MEEKKLEKHKVNSSNLDWVAYDKDEKKLYIGFKSSGAYVYYDVPEDVYNDLMKAGSKGRYFWIKIRDVYKYEKL